MDQRYYTERGPCHWFLAEDSFLMRDLLLKGDCRRGRDIAVIVTSDGREELH